MTLQSVAGQGRGYISISKVDCTNILPSSKNNSRTQNSSVQLNCRTYHQTTNYTCGQAAVMTLLRFYGRISESDMNSKTELRMSLEMGADASGTSMSAMTSWLSNHGFSVDSGTRVSSEIIINNLKRNVPTIVAVNNHWILAKGFTKGGSSKEDEILFSDSCCGVTVMSANDFDSIGNEAMMPENHCAQNIGEYIVAVPR